MKNPKELEDDEEEVLSFDNDGSTSHIWGPESHEVQLEYYGLNGYSGQKSWERVCTSMDGNAEDAKSTKCIDQFEFYSIVEKIDDTATLITETGTIGMWSGQSDIQSQQDELFIN